MFTRNTGTARRLFLAASLAFFGSLGGFSTVTAQVTSHEVNPDALPQEILGSAYATMLVAMPEALSTSESSQNAAGRCTPATQASLKSKSKIVGGTATLVVPAGSCPVEVSFTTYMLPGGKVRPFEDQVVYRNVTATYGPGTHTINLALPACAWQSDLYLGPVVTQLIPNVGHPTNRIFAWAYLENVNQACARASLGDVIWVDSNRNGKQNTNEVGIDGVTVTLYDSNDVQRGQTTTSGGGKYLFSNLLPGTYYVVVSGYPDTYRITQQDSGSNNAIDSDVDSAGRSESVTLAVGDAYRDLDGGLILSSVRPILENVFAQCDGTFRAEFGYLNEDSRVVTIPVGSDNRLTPSSFNGAQTTDFQPGRVESAYSIAWDGTGNVVWSLRGPDGRNRTATAGTGNAIPATGCVCATDDTAPSYAGGYVLNAAQTRAFVQVDVPAGGTTFEFYNTRNLVVAMPEDASETPLTGVTSTGTAFAFTAASPTTVYFPISRADANVPGVAFYLRVTDTCGRTVDVDPAFALTGVEGEGAEAWMLDQNVPNPFAGETAITFSLAEASQVQLAVYDMMGREVARLTDGLREAGTHTVRLNAQALPAGQYVYRLRAGGRTFQHLMTLAR